MREVVCIERNLGLPTGLNEDRVACLEDLVVALLEMEKFKQDDSHLLAIQESAAPEKWGHYDLHPNTVCKYHLRIGRKNCALARAQKPM